MFAAARKRKALPLTLKVLHSMAVPLQAMPSSTSGSFNAEVRNACKGGFMESSWSLQSERPAPRFRRGLFGVAAGQGAEGGESGLVIGGQVAAPLLLRPFPIGLDFISTRL